MHIYTQIYVCLYVCMYIYTRVHVYMYFIHIYLLFICIIYIFICIIYIYLYIHICIFSHMHENYVIKIFTLNQWKIYQSYNISLIK